MNFVARVTGCSTHGPVAAHIHMGCGGRRFPSRSGIVSGARERLSALRQRVICLFRCSGSGKWPLRDRGCPGPARIPRTERPRAQNLTISQHFTIARFRFATCNMATRARAGGGAADLGARWSGFRNRQAERYRWPCVNDRGLRHRGDHQQHHRASCRRARKENYLLGPTGRGRMWCWFRDRHDSPFYPRMSLKWLKRKQPWSELTGDVAAEIAAR